MKYSEYLAKDMIIGKVVALILSTGVEQKKIKEWCQKNPQNGLAEHQNNSFHYPRIPDNVLPCEGWEASFQWVANSFDNFRELSEWETASNAERKAQCMKVAKLARDLADALMETPCYYYPPVLELFDEDKALDIVGYMREDKIRAILQFTKYGDDPNFVLFKVAHMLSFPFFPREQQFPSVLRRLADYSEGNMLTPKRIKRPKTGHPNARAFAWHMAEAFKRMFGRTPYEVIAACVCLKYPELEEPPSADTIRDWLGVK